MEKVVEELKLAELKKGNLLKEIDNIQKVSSSLFLFSLHWKDLELHYDSVKSLVDERVKEAEMSIREQSEEARRGLESRERELMRKERNLIDLREGVFEETGKKRKELLEVEEKVEEMKKKVERREKVVLWKEKIVEKMRKDVVLSEEEVGKIKELIHKRCGELELAESKLRLLEAKMDEQLKEIELKEERVKRFVRLSEEQCKKLEVKESEFNLMKKSVELMLEDLKFKEQCSQVIQFEIDKRFTELDMKEKASNLIQGDIDKRTKELDDREDAFVSAHKEVSLRSKRLDVEEKSFESLQKEIDQRSQEVDMKLKSLDASKKEIDRWYEELKAKDMSLTLIQEELGQQVALLEGKQEIFYSIKKEIDRSNEELEVKRKCFDVVHKEVNQRSADLEAKEKSLHLNQKAIDQAIDDLEAKEKCFEEQIDLRIAELENKEQQLEVWSHEVELKEKSLHYVKQTIKEQAQLILYCCREAHREPISKDKQHTSAQKVIEKCLMDSIMENCKELDLKDKQMRSMLKSLEACSKDFELKENMIKNINQERVKIDVSECLTENRANNALSADIKFSASMDGKNLQILLNKLLKKNESVQHEVPIALETSANPAMLVLDAMQGFYPPHLKDGDLEFEASVVRESCIFLLKQLKNMSPLIESSVRDEALKLANEWHRQIKLEAKDSLEVLGFFELIATYRLNNAFDAAELLSYAESVAEHEKLPELRKALGFAEVVSYDAIYHSNAKSAQSELSDVHEASEVACRNDQCIISDAKSMLLLLKEHSNNEESLVVKVHAVLHTSRHPEKLVLDTLKLYCSQHCTVKLYKEYRASFILLLKQLKRIGPKITPDVREAAMKLASHWKEELIDKSEHDSPLADLGFLWILAVYGLESSFTEDEVLRLLKAVAESKEARGTCEVLGFEEKFTEHIEVLIQQKKCFEAVKYACSFGLEKRFAVGPLLEAEVKRCKDNADRLREIGNSPAVLPQALYAERDGLKAIIKFIRNHKLEDQYAPENLEKHILQLEEDWAKEITEQRKASKIEKRKRFEKKKSKRQKTAHSAESVTPAKQLVADHGPPVSHSSGRTYNPDTRTHPNWHHPGGSSFSTYPYPNPYVGQMRPGIVPPYEAPFLLPPPAFMYNFPASYSNPEGRGPWPYL